MTNLILQLFFFVMVVKRTWQLLNKLIVHYGLGQKVEVNASF